MNRNTLQALAIELAVSHKRVTNRLFRSPFGNFVITKQQEAVFDEYYKEAENHCFDEEIPDSATEWFVDNYYAIKMQLKSIKKSIHNIPHDIPVLSDGIMKGFPRIYAIAVEYIDFNSGVVTENGITEFLEQYQKELVLTMDELWSLSAAFSLALARNILTLACRRYEALVSARNIKRTAEEVCQRNDLKAESLESLVNVNDAAKLASFITAIQNAPDCKGVLRWLDSELSRINMSANEVLEFSRHIESNCVITIRNSITSLMKINMFDWERIFGNVCIADAVFSSEDDGTYAKMDSESKNIYRKKLKQKAKKLHISETECAERILAEANEEKCHIGKILFENNSGTSLIKRLLYIVGLYSVTFMIFGISLGLLGKSGINTVLFIISAFIMYIPCRAVALVLVNFIASKLVKPTRFLRLDFEKGIPKECSTVVVTPALIVNTAQAELLAENMEINYISNKSDNISFVLLGDFADSDCGKNVDDEQIKAFTNSKINALNVKYGKRIFFYMHRDRQFNESQNRWFGWERKRGAVIQFNRFLQSGNTKDFCFASAGIESIVGSKYVITLDADTKMPIGSAFALVGTADHPLNRPVFDPATATVKSGRGILQPRMDTSLTSALKTRFSMLMAGSSGSEPYVNSVSEIYQDIFGKGSFAGKGIYDSKVFCDVIDGRFPENAILSHDMIEGGYLRSGYVSDVVFVDDVPSNYISYRKRAHRWMRGDWQLLPYLMPITRNSAGKRIYNYLDGTTKYKIYENLLRTLIEPAICLLLIIGIFIKEIFLSAVILFALQSVLPCIFELLSVLWLKITQNEHKRISFDIFTRAILNMLLAADCAFNNIDAVIRTIARLKSKKKLLEWQTAMQSESSNKGSLRSYYNVMLYSALFGGALFISALISSRLLEALIGGAFMLAPFAVYRLSRAKKEKETNLSAEAEEIIEFTAKGAWNYFKELCTEQTHYLPPDNFQEEPYKGAVMRTSPTNIGMMLCGCVAAEELGFLSDKEAVLMLSKSIATLDKLEKWNGHPYNWYDITTLKPLHPMFVSSADNGNLACCLVAVRQALCKYKDTVTDAEILIKLNESISSVQSILKSMDFSLLYDEKKDLFSVGFDVEAQKLSEYAYDMFASEARQTSFYALISGEVGIKHWQRLSRIVVKRSGRYILKSWSGSMFEYLMPALLLKTYDNTLWSNAFDGIIEEQMRYARKVKRPWGISESGYWHFDGDKYYQYKAFGIPYAAVRHTKTGEYVVAPYATALALPFAPEKAAKNLKRLKQSGMCSRYGFYEAVDTSGDSDNIIKSFMAHHEGMSLIAAANCLKKDCMINLFHSAPEVKAGEILLQEKLPSVVRPDAVPRQTIDKTPDIYAKSIEESFNGITQHPHCAMLTNGSLSMVVSNSGSNIAFAGDTVLNKWKSDEIAEQYGHFIFIKDEESGFAYSVTPSPVYGKSSYNSVTFKPDSITFVGKVRGIESNLNITVCPDRNAAVFRLRIKSTHSRTKKLTVADYFEPALETLEESYSHPAYSDMFVESRYLSDNNAIVTQRTPRTDEKSKQFAAVMAVCPKSKAILPITSRYDFIGRNKTSSNPAFFSRSFDYDSLSRSTLSPCASLAVQLSLAQGESAQIDYILAYSDNYSDILNITEHYANPDNCTRAFELAFEHSKISMQYKRIDSKRFRLANSILSALYYQKAFRHNAAPCGKTLLWQFGISGDLPIICCKTSGAEKSGLKLILSAYEYISSGNVKADLVLITGDDGYHKSNYDEVYGIVSTSSCRDMIGKKGGIFILKSELNPHECAVIAQSAAVSVHGSEAQIFAQTVFEDKCIRKENVSILPKLIRKDTSKNEEILPQLMFFNGYGGFNEAKSEYTILLDNGINTPAPWSNVLANADFGTVVTESAGGYTWYKNSRENKLTSWCNDPVSDVPSEAVYIKDDSTMQYISPERIADGTGQYTVSYGLGYAVYRHSANKLSVAKTVFVPASDSIKVSVLEIKNESDISKKLSVYYYADCNLSPAASAVPDNIALTVRKASGIVYAENMNIPENGYMFAGCTGVLEAVLSRKSDFFGRTGGFPHPKALDYSSWSTSGERVCADCIVLKTSVEIKPHCVGTIVLTLGGAESVQDIQRLKSKYSSPEKAKKQLDDTALHYSALTRPFKITTNDKALDMLFNNFLMYQAYVCRYHAKTSFYQCSGAYGFRDQLQDVLAFMYCDKSEAKTHILRAARQQFEEGDVRHWWHEATGYGIRTKISDDLVFLPYVSSEYAQFSGDMEIFNEQVPFVRGQEIKEGKNSDFGKAYFSDNTASLYEHCMLALKRSLRIGPHSLPLIGTGDWNDGFDKIGENGKGESVWLAFFIHRVIRDFIKVCGYFNKTDDMKFLAEACNMLERGIKQSAWDGKWYRRAYYDDGTPVGNNECDECKIDVIAQAWAAIADITPNEQINEALESAEKYLVDEENGIVKLFWPPFKNTDHNPGYIKAYKCGIRENGGQYTHGAIWLVTALAMRGEAAKAMRILKMLNPVNHALTKEQAEKYKVEPYVVAADVYSASTNVGMGGWTWYTGSAAWMYKTILENILGIKIKNDKMRVEPVVEKDMLPFRVEYHRENGSTKTKYIIDVICSEDKCRLLDGKDCPDGEITLTDDGKTHKIIVSMNQ